MLIAFQKCLELLLAFSVKFNKKSNSEQSFVEIDAAMQLLKAVSRVKISV